MATRTDWLAEGLRVLATEGITALTIDRLSAALGLSKGSFYHHFAGMPAFRTALLAHYEAMFTTRYIRVVEGQGHRSGTARLNHLLELVLSEHGADSPEPAFRAWAASDPEARAAMERVDATRVGYLRDQWRSVTDEAGTEAGEAETVGTLLYLIVLGAAQLLPRSTSEELRRIYELLMRRLPGGGSPG